MDKKIRVQIEELIFKERNQIFCNIAEYLLRDFREFENDVDGNDIKKFLSPPAFERYRTMSDTQKRRQRDIVKTDIKRIFKSDIKNYCFNAKYASNAIKENHFINIVKITAVAEILFLDKNKIRLGKNQNLPAIAIAPLQNLTKILEDWADEFCPPENIKLFRDKHR